MASFQRVIMAGHMTRDPELQHVGNDDIPLCKFGLAVNRTRSKNEEVDFFDVEAWRGLGETINQYKGKGDPLLIEGRIQQDRWEDQEGNNRSKHKLVAENVQFLGRAGGNGDDDTAQKAQRARQNLAGQENQDAVEEIDYDDIPF